MSFDRIFQFTLQWEGGSKYTNDPDDLGGETKYGISKKAHPNLDIAKLTEDDAAEIYKEQYWDKVAKGVDDKFDMVCFDSCVNIGVSRVKGFQKTVTNWEDIVYLRRKHYFVIINGNPSLAKYSKGWERRCLALEEFIKSYVA